jgi:preprotein translocase subunit SecF
MFQIFKDINVNWMGLRKPLIMLSILVLLAGLISAIGRQAIEGGTNAFNLGVDFQGGTVITAKFRQKPSEDEIRAALQNQGVADAVIQSSIDKQDEVLIKVPLFEGVEGNQSAQTSNQAANTNAAANTQNAGQDAAPAVPNTQVNIGRETTRRHTKSSEPIQSVR